MSNDERQWCYLEKAATFPEGPFESRDAALATANANLGPGAEVQIGRVNEARQVGELLAELIEVQCGAWWGGDYGPLETLAGERAEAMTDAKRPTWAELKDQAPGLCEAVVGWLERKGYPHSVAADLLEGKTDTDPFYHLHDECLPAIRLRAAEYRMEAEAAERAMLTVLQGSPLKVKRAEAYGEPYHLAAYASLQADAAKGHVMANALDAAADEAEAKAGGAT